MFGQGSRDGVKHARLVLGEDVEHRENRTDFIVYTHLGGWHLGLGPIDDGRCAWPPRQQHLDARVPRQHGVQVGLDTGDAALVGHRTVGLLAYTKHIQGLVLSVA